jgi:hypothetical protein
MYPNSSTNLTVVITELLVNPGNNTGKVVWSEPCASGCTALTVGSIITLDPSLVASGATYVIYGQVQYSYQPVAFMSAMTSVTLSATQILVARSAAQMIVQWGS